MRNSVNAQCDWSAQKGGSVPWGTTITPAAGFCVCHSWIGGCCGTVDCGGAMKLDALIIGKRPTRRKNVFNGGVRFEAIVCNATGFCSPEFCNDTRVCVRVLKVYEYNITSRQHRIGYLIEDANDANKESSRVII